MRPCGKSFLKTERVSPRRRCPCVLTPVSPISSFISESGQLPAGKETTPNTFPTREHSVTTGSAERSCPAGSDPEDALRYPAAPEVSPSRTRVAVLSVDLMREHSSLSTPWGIASAAGALLHLLRIFYGQCFIREQSPLRKNGESAAHACSHSGSTDALSPSPLLVS